MLAQDNNGHFHNGYHCERCGSNITVHIPTLAPFPRVIHICICGWNKNEELKTDTLDLIELSTLIEKR